jgi:hypothetical protein
MESNGSGGGEDFAALETQAQALHERAKRLNIEGKYAGNKQSRGLGPSLLVTRVSSSLVADSDQNACRVPRQRRRRRIGRCTRSRTEGWRCCSSGAQWQAPCRRPPNTPLSTGPDPGPHQV